MQKPYSLTPPPLKTTYEKQQWNVTFLINNPHTMLKVTRERIKYFLPMFYKSNVSLLLLQHSKIFILGFTLKECCLEPMKRKEKKTP